MSLKNLPKGWSVMVYSDRAGSCIELRRAGTMRSPFDTIWWGDDFFSHDQVSEKVAFACRRAKELEAE